MRRLVKDQHRGAGKPAHRRLLRRHAHNPRLVGQHQRLVPPIARGLMSSRDTKSRTLSTNSPSCRPLGPVTTTSDPGRYHARYSAAIAHTELLPHCREQFNSSRFDRDRKTSACSSSGSKPNRCLTKPTASNPVSKSFQPITTRSPPRPESREHRLPRLRIWIQRRNHGTDHPFPILIRLPRVPFRRNRPLPEHRPCPPFFVLKCGLHITLSSPNIYTIRSKNRIASEAVHTNSVRP